MRGAECKILSSKVEASTLLNLTRENKSLPMISKIHQIGRNQSLFLPWGSSKNVRPGPLAMQFECYLIPFRNNAVGRSAFIMIKIIKLSLYIFIGFQLRLKIPDINFFRQSAPNTLILGAISHMALLSF